MSPVLWNLKVRIITHLSRTVRDKSNVQRLVKYERRIRSRMFKLHRGG